MRKLLFSLIIGSILFSVLFLSCDFFMPQDVQENITIKNYDLERKDVLALKHLQNPNISENTLANYVMDFINVTTVSETRTARNVQLPVPAVIIAKTIKITHTVQTGFAETTANKRSATSVISSGQIPFYVFTLENQQTEKTGFALTCGDSRIGSVLAVVEEGNYDDDNPFMGIFYSCLNDYIENTISIYNSITEADIKNALKKISNARTISQYIPVTDVGAYSDFLPVGDINDNEINNEKYILKTKWSQGEPYNNYLNEKIYHPDGWYRVLGCGTIATGQIMAFHCKPKKSTLLNSYTFDWSAMVKDEDKDAIGKLLYEVYHHSGSIAIKLGTNDSKDKDKKNAATATTRNGIRDALIAMGYKDSGSFKSYDLSKVKKSISDGYPVIADGSSSGITILGITIATPIHGHYWVIDGYRRMKVNIKNDKSADKIECPTDFVHCNMGWGGNANGWYDSGVFHTKKIPLKDNEKGSLSRSATEDGFYQYGLGILTNIQPKN